MAGDQITILCRSIWHNTGAQAGSYKISSALNTFLNAFAGTSAVAAGGHGLVTGATLNSASATASLLGPLLDNTQNQSDPTTMPKAAVNWILFNDQFVPVASGTDLVSPRGDAFKPHGIMNQQMIANGYLYVYCSNESDIDVYFDNLQVVNKRGPILEETHYYPFGMAMAGISDKAWNKLQNLNRFNGNELQSQEFSDGTGLEEYDFNARTYDQQLGRFMQQDPASLSAGQERLSPYQFGYNNPATFNDPDGQCPPCILALAGAIVGGIVNVATHWSAINEGGSFSWGTLGSAFAVGAISGAVGAFTGGSSFAAIGIAGFWGGAFSGAIGGAFSSLISGIGNGIAFGDPYTLSDWSRDITTSAVFGGTISGITALSQGLNFWDGTNHFVPQFSTVVVKVEPIPDGEINTSNALEGTEGNPNNNFQGVNSNSMVPQKPEWDLPPSPRGFAIEKIVLDEDYHGWEHLPRAPTIDGISPDGTSAVSIKSTMSTKLNVTQNILRLADMPFTGDKVLQIVTPPDHIITNLARIYEVAEEYGIKVIVTHH